MLDGLDAVLRELGAAQANEILSDDAAVLGPLLASFQSVDHLDRLGAEVAATGEGRTTTVADAEVGQARLFTSLVAVLRRAAGPRPVVVVVEDVHLAGRSSLEWLRFAVRRGARLLVVATRRPGEGLELRAEATIGLAPLDSDAVAALVGPERAGELLTRSGGNPLFLVELAASSGGDLPASITEAVARRIDGLGDAALTVRTAAVLGQEFDIDLLAQVTGRSVADLLEHLEAAARVALVEEHGAGLRFRHELVREALVVGTSAARRAYVHREAARALVVRPHHDPLAVAWHARQAGDLDQAALALVEASSLAASRFDLVAAEAHADDAIGLADSVTARMTRARIRLARWNMEAALDDVHRALALGAGPSALELAGWASYYRRDYEAAARALDEALAATDDASLRASCLTLGGRMRHARGDLHTAEEWLVEAANGSSGTRRLAQLWLSSLRGHQGRATEALDLVERALLGAENLGHPFAIYHALFSHALCLGMLGRPLEALVVVNRLEESSARAGESAPAFSP